MKSRFIHDGAGNSLDFYNEHKVLIKECIHSLESLQKLFAGRILSPIHGERFSMVRVEGDGGASWLAQVFHSFHLNARPK